MGIQSIARLTDELRQQGFSDAAISFVQRAAQGSLDDAASPHIAEGILQSSMGSVRQFMAATENADQIAALFRRHNLLDGTVSGAVAAGLLMAEGMYATHKTQDNYENPEEALASNFARVAVASGTTTVAAHMLSRPGIGSRLGGLLFASAAAYSVGTGTILIATEQMNTLTARDIEDARERLETLLEQERALAGQRQEQRAEINAEISSLREERTDILSAGIPESMTLERDRLETELARLETQLEAYNVDITEDSLQLEYAAQLREQGFEHVGINQDGDASNDALYRQNLLPQINEDIAEIRERLAPILEEIQARTVNAGDEELLSDAERSRLAQIDARIATLTANLDNMDEDDQAMETLQDAINSATRHLSELEAAEIGPDDNLMERVREFANTEDGFTAMSAGAIFGLLSVLGGVALHRGISAFTNRGAIPEVLPGAIRIDGFDLGHLSDPSYIARMNAELETHARLLGSPDGMESALRQAAQSEFGNFGLALQRAYDSGLLDEDQYRMAASRLAEAGGHLPELLSGQTAFFDDVLRVTEPGRAGIAGAAALDHAHDAARVARTARIGSNITGVGVAIGVTGAAATIYMLTSQEAAAAELRDHGVITEEAYQAYISDVIQPSAGVLMSDVGLSTLDPFGVTIPVTLVAESVPASFMQDWIDEHAPFLSQDVVDALTPSMYGNDTIPTEMVDALSRNIPANIDGQDPRLHNVIMARTAMVEFYRENPPPHVPMMAPQEIVMAAAEEQRLWQARMDAYRATFMDELTDLVADPENLGVYLDLYSVNERLELVRRLAESDTQLADGSSQFPEISHYVQSYENTFLPGIFGLSADNVFHDHPSYLNDYITHRMGIGQTVEMETLQAANVDTNITPDPEAVHIPAAHEIDAVAAANLTAQQRAYAM